jgi:glycosyltransferase involved in cell wall biosynthesis
MRILFSCRQYLPRIGGVQLSVHQLALQLATRGHDVGVLTTTDAFVEKRRGLGRVFGGGGSGGTFAVDDQFPYPAWRVGEPDRGPGAVIDAFSPDVVVANVGGRTTLAFSRGVERAATKRDIPACFYFRDVEGVVLLDDRSTRPAAVLTNAQRITDLVAERGWSAPTIPSVVETGAYRTESTREVVLFVNPRSQRKGVDIAWALAAARPDVPFVFLEAWRFTPEIRAELEARARPLGNVEIRPSVRELDRIYADARLLFAPYEDSRPRVVAEAQSNAIPVLGANVPALVEAVGAGGVLVDFDAPIDAWVAALAQLWDDREAYARYCEAAREHSQRDDMRPEWLAERFETELERVRGTAAR